MADIRTLLAQSAGFEWDAVSSTAEEPEGGSEGGVTRAECEQLFLNEPLVVPDEAIDAPLVATDATRSSRYVRGHALGETDEGRLLFAAFAIRDGSIRVTGARPMTRSERQVYTDVRDEEESS